MQKPTARNFVIGASLGLALYIAGTLPAAAGANEDYEEGKKIFLSGDLVTSVAPLRRAADAGHAKAQVVLAEILDRADSDAEAVAYYRKAAEQGNADGQLGLAGMLLGGEGTPRNVAEAKQWLRKAADQGHKLAVNEMASSYLTNAWEIPEEQRKTPEALAWIRKAADNNFIPAMDALSNAYRKGDFGLTADAKLADQWADAARKARGIKPGRRNRGTVPTGDRK